MQTKTGTRFFSPGKAFLQRLDYTTLLPQYNKEISLETSRGDKALEYQVLEKLGNKPVLLASYFNKQKDKIELFGRKYNLDGDPEGKEKKIAEFSAERKKQIEDLRFVHAMDSSKILAYFSEKFEKFKNEKIQFILFDRNLDIQMNRTIEFPYSGDNFSIQKSAVGKDGRVYLLVRINVKNKSGNMPFKYSLVTFGPEKELTEDYQIEIEDKTISDVQFCINNPNEIMVAGFYGPESQNLSEGIFFTKVDRGMGSVMLKNKIPFEKEFVRPFHPESSSKKNIMFLPDFKIDYLIQYPDSSYALIAEQFKMDEICFQDFRTATYSCNYIYNYNNVLVIKLTEKGELSWMADIPKFQETMNDGGLYSSYAFGRTDSNLYFIFNDNPMNFSGKTKSDIAVMNNINKALPSLVILNNQGELSRKELNVKKSRFLFIPSYSTQIDNQSLMMIGSSSNKYRVGMYYFEK